MKRSNNNLLPRGLWALTLMALLAVITPIRAQQPESPSPVKINVEQASSESTTLLQLFRLGGWSMWL